MLPGLMLATTGSLPTKRKVLPSRLTASSARIASSLLTATVAGLHWTSNFVGVIHLTGHRYARIWSGSLPLKRVPATASVAPGGRAPRCAELSGMLLPPGAEELAGAASCRLQG